MGVNKLAQIKAVALLLRLYPCMQTASMHADSCVNAGLSSMKARV